MLTVPHRPGQGEPGTTATVHLTSILPVGPVVAVPLTAGGGGRGVLMVGRLRGHRGFSAAEVEMATTFASHASVALELA